MLLGIARATLRASVGRGAEIVAADGARTMSPRRGASRETCIAQERQYSNKRVQRRSIPSLHEIVLITEPQERAHDKYVVIHRWRVAVGHPFGVAHRWFAAASA